MNKSLRISLFVLVLVFLLCGKCFAANIDMNLASNLVDFSSNVVSNNEVANNSTNNTNNTNAISNDTASSNSTSTNTSSSSATFSNLPSLPESELGLTNILNILLIAVGVVLILLAVAIFIRLKK